jgi:competence protein ComFC
MITCLLCHTTFRPLLSFSDLFLSRPYRQSICPDCFSQFEPISAPHCQICYQPDVRGICPDCTLCPDPIPHRARYHYNAFAKDYFQRYKFQGDFRLRSAFNSVLRQTLKGQQIVPIPVSSQRLQERGFNQLTGFLNSAQLPYLELLDKKETAHQSHLTRQERLATDNPFSLKTGAHIPKQLIIFDDIYTTGTTLKHAAETLKNAGCPHVSTFSLFR